MTVESILSKLISGDIPRAVEIFAPELILCATIIGLLFVRLLGLDRRIPACWVALIGTLLAFTCVFAQFMYVSRGAMADASLQAGLTDKLAALFHITPDGVGSVGGYFTGLLMHDSFTLFYRLGLFLFSVLVIALTVLSGIPDNEDGPDFYTLLLGSIVGMQLAVSANHLLMLFLAVEMMSVPSYAMVGFLKGRRQSSEAALKYVVYGAGAAGVMLYGISLLAGLLGAGELSELGPRFVTVLADQPFAPTNPTAVTLVLGVLMVIVGLAFKLSLVPFHFWCPDAFEGAAAEVGGFLSVASKAAAFALLVRFVLAFGGEAEVLQGLRLFIGLALALLAGISMTFGNLAAYAQTNVKRLLAYSTIAHAGYMLMAVAATLLLTDAVPPEGWTAATLHDEAVRGLEGLTYYLAVYLFMNLVAFTVVAMLRNETYSEEIDSYNGLIYQNPATKTLCVCMLIAMFSLVGLPPFGGFFAKLMIFMATFKAGYLHWGMWVLLAVAGANTVFSLFYYVRVLKAMFISPEPVERRVLHTPGVAATFVALISLPILALGMFPYLPDRLASTANHVARVLFQ